MLIAGLSDNSIMIYCRGKAVIIGEDVSSKPMVEYLGYIRRVEGDGASVSVRVDWCGGPVHYVTITSRHVIVDNLYYIPIDILYGNPYPKLLVVYSGASWTCREECTHLMHVEDNWLGKILAGEKVVEGRLYDEKRRRMSIGDCIIFKSNSTGREVYAYVKYLRVYPSFRNMILAEGLNRVLPGVRSIDEGVKVYYKYYSKGDEERYGVLAIGLGLL